MTRTLVLLGDSVFDNGSYVSPGQADVSAHLKRRLESTGWTLEMRAVDGAVVRDVGCQIDGRPVGQPGMAALSVGGNDALGHFPMIEDETTVGSYRDMLLSFSAIRNEFRAQYATVLDRSLRQWQRLVVCTIYNPAFPDPDTQRLAETGLAFFNDAITEEALRRDLPIIDLRSVCSDSRAFANPIEPSEHGGGLIADAIMRQLPE